MNSLRISKKSASVNFSAPRKHILLLNNYSMQEALNGTAPANHLFGCSNLPPGWTFSTPPKMAHTLMRQLPWSSKLIGAMWATVGDPLQVIWTMRHAKRSSLVWATTQAIAPTLGLLRRLGLLRIPLAVLVHNTAAKKYTRFWLEGADAIIVFSEPIRTKLIQQGVRSDRLYVAEWGPDTEWAGYTKSSEAPVHLDFMSTGKTHRDYTSLSKAAELGKMDGEIFNGSELLSFRKGSLNRIANRPRLSNVEVIRALCRADVVVIPTSDPPEANGLTGITELADAVAMGKPVVMTSNHLLPIDIDALGIGVSVPKDADPRIMLNAILKARSIDSDAVRAVGRTWNERAFSQSLLDVFEFLLQSRESYSKSR